MSSLKEILQQHVADYQVAYQEKAEELRLLKEKNIQQAVEVRLYGIKDKLIDAAKKGHRYYIIEKEAEVLDTSRLDWQNPRLPISHDFLTGVSAKVCEQLKKMDLDVELWQIRSEDGDNVYHFVQMRVVW